ncbi:MULTISPECIES: Fur family transcriptional regulator [unclassified Carboxylicivirga]|uniref:Fur family transcriptional regulator n=1 Tax=Carboxylicivirga TaxID=1628153 RepID=UPI003D337965
MNESVEAISKKLADKGLKVTPQRIAILAAIYQLGGHPTADNIIENIRRNHPHIASGTVYKILDILVDNKLVKRVHTERDVMRYDGIMERHHHLYCGECDLIEDYVDETLDQLLEDYFKSKQVKGFRMREFVLQITGTFDKC